MKLPSTHIDFLGSLALAVILGLGCKRTESSKAVANDDQIVIGEFASLTGKEAAFGQSSHRGTELAVEELNRAGGVLGRQILHLVEDNRSQAGESVTIVKKFISRDSVVAVLGEVASGRSLEAAPICQRAQIPMVSPGSTEPSVTEVGDCIFRVCFIDSFQGKVMADFAAKTLKVKRVAILSDVTSPYSMGLSKFFRERFTAIGGVLVLEHKYSGGDKDFKAQLTAIKAAGVDAIFLPGYYVDAGLIIAQARQLDISLPLLGADGWEAPELIQIAGSKALEGTYYSTNFSAESADLSVQAFVKAYRAKFNGDTPDGIAALGYDSLMVVAAAIRRAGSTDGAKLRDALAATRDFPCVGGRITFDANRNPAKPAVIITVKDGKFRYLQTVEP